MSTEPEFIPARQTTVIELIAELARQIWNEYYPPIIGQAQVDYMVPRFQSAAAIEQQIRAGDEYFLIRQAGVDAGYLAVRAEPERQRLFISKLYIIKVLRGRGLSRRTLAWLARQRTESIFWLTVNKHNPALAAYLRLGFCIVKDVVTDIGGGYVMDDYLLEWNRSSA